MDSRFSDATGFIFDCDGTLLDTMEAWYTLEDDLFARATIPFTDEQLDEIHALPIQMSAGRFFEHGVGESAEDVVNMLDTGLLGFYQNKAEALPGAVEFVRAAQAAGIPCTVVSSSPQRYVVAGLKRVGIADAFVRLITTEDVGMSKQDPGIYKLAMQEMGSVAASTWGFDDALYALKVMRETGLHTCGCHDDDNVGTFEQLSSVADIAIHSFTELL